LPRAISAQELPTGFSPFSGYIPVMKETTLRFLMTNGAEAYTFRPALTPEQYAELHQIVKEQDCVAGLKAALQAFAAKCNLELAVDSA
jgi:hypothetical protein